MAAFMVCPSACKGTVYKDNSTKNRQLIHFPTAVTLTEIPVKHSHINILQFYCCSIPVGQSSLGSSVNNLCHDSLLWLNGQKFKKRYKPKWNQTAHEQEYPNASGWADGMCATSWQELCVVGAESSTPLRGMLLFSVPKNLPGSPGYYYPSSNEHVLLKSRYFLKDLIRSGNITWRKPQIVTFLPNLYSPVWKRLKASYMCFQEHSSVFSEFTQLKWRHWNSKAHQCFWERDTKPLSFGQEQTWGAEISSQTPLK